jgi:two-component system chemotaxis sensor kinase CheA
MDEDIDDEFLQEILAELINESNEGLDQVEKDLIELESNTYDADTINRIFRVVHTIKGSSGAVGFNTIMNLAHKGENLLDNVRSGKVEVTPDMVSLLLLLLDALRAMFANVESEGNEGNTDYSKLEEDLKAAAENTIGSQPVEKKDEVVVESEEESSEEELHTEENISEATVETTAKASPQAKAQEPSKGKAPAKPIAESFIRVDVKQLDTLMNMVGELVLARNQITQQVSMISEESILVSAAQRLNMITSELQQNMMKTRMQPVESAWTKFPRVIRDYSSKLNKKINLIMEGKETELDRTLIDAIKDPLMHIIRNSVDHGLEGPEERLAAGKSDTGTLTLKAYHESGLVNIEIIDDGRGINVERVKSKAVEKGVITQAQADTLSERDAVNLIFHPGFSTAEKVSDISGRGVGMDVVKSNIEKIGGSVDFRSVQGKGTNLKIKIPLTLAIIPALIVTTANERFAIPQMSLLELVRIEDESARKNLDFICGTPVYRLREKLLPLVSLNEQLGLPCQDLSSENAEGVNIVVLQSDGKPFGLIVDEINDSEEIVVKPLGDQLKHIPAYAGATIMGDGRVALILDILGIANTSKAMSANHQEIIQAENNDSHFMNNEQTLLLFMSGTEGRMAVPLSKVDRIEELKRTEFQHVRGETVIEYRGKILKIIDLSYYISGLNSVNFHEMESIPVIVYSSNGNSIGIMVSEILDVTESDLSVGDEKNQPGVTGSYSINDYVTDIVNLDEIIEMALPLKQVKSA